MANELMVQFGTGGDDLRGGNDNVHLILLLQSGRHLQFNNVNEGRGWGNNSSQTVVRPLPATLSWAEIVGVRLETTFGGGIGGDNWNLDYLRVRVQLNGEERLLFEQRGAPLFRFTGNERIREFRFSPVVLPPAPAVMTTFVPAQHGFKFVNNFANIVISELDFTTSGLCGGMVYTALDYFHHQIPVPVQDYMPAEGTLLQSYLYNRQVKSIENTLDKWIEFGFNPLGARNREFFNWGLQVGSGRLGELRERIDRGEPVPLGLQACGSDCGCPGGCPGSHQVLAIGYELGRYKGDLGENIEDLAIFVYDPNFPGRQLTLKPHVGGAMYYYLEETRCRWRAYYVDLKYVRNPPPTIRQEPYELIVQFDTGGDDLRGGNDNIHLNLLLHTGGDLRFPTVNDRKRWINNSSQTIVRPLPTTLHWDEIAGVRLETSFGGGIGGDNWNLDYLRVRARLNGQERQLFADRGAPLMRFTSDQRAREFRFPSLPLEPSLRAFVPLALYWSPARGDNFTTATGIGKQSAVDAGYDLAWVEGYVHGAQQLGTIPLELYWNGVREDNFTVATQSGRDLAKAHGYTFVRIEGYLYPTQQVGTVPLQLYWSEARLDHLVTATAKGRQRAETAGYRYVRVEGYLYPNAIALRAANGQYVCAEGGGGREVVANRPAIRGWETFAVVYLGDNRIALRADNGQYVCAEGGGGREVVANCSEIHEWAIFTMIPVNGSMIGLRTHNGQYLCAEGGGGREVVANRPAIREWETFEIVSV